MFDELAQEAARILSNEEMQSGSDCPIALAMRLLICETKIMTGRCDEAIEQLQQMKHWLQNGIAGALNDDSGEVGKISNEMKKVTQLWEWRLQCAITNAFIRLRQWRLAIVELRAMLASVSVHFSSQSSQAYSQIALLCLLSRVLLQVRLSCLFDLFWVQLKLLLGWSN
jgi:hypothetical protein